MNAVVARSDHAWKPPPPPAPLPKLSVSLTGSLPPQRAAVSVSSLLSLLLLLPPTHTRTGVPAATSAKLKANEWVNSALSLLGGKGGGKPTVAQGQGNEFGKAADALTAAEQFAAMKL